MVSRMTLLMIIVVMSMTNGNALMYVFIKKCCFHCLQVVKVGVEKGGIEGYQAEAEVYRWM